MGVGSWMGVGGFGVCVVVEWVWFWVVCGWRDVCGWWVWMVMGCGWLWSLCGWRGMGGHRGVTSWRRGWLREIMRKYILDDVSNATKIPSQSSDWQALMRLRTLSPTLGIAYKTEQAPQCLVSSLYFWSAIHNIFIKCNHVWSSFIESVLWCTTCIMTSSSQSLSLGLLWCGIQCLLYIYIVIIVSTKSCRSLSTTINGTCVNATFRNWFVEVM